MSSKKRTKKMGQNKKNILTQILQTSRNYFKNDFPFWGKSFISKGYSRVELNRKQGIIGK